MNVDDSIIHKALESDFNDFEDAIQYFTAIENNMDCIITRNVNDYKKSIIPVYTPTELLKQIEIKGHTYVCTVPATQFSQCRRAATQRTASVATKP